MVFEIVDFVDEVVLVVVSANVEGREDFVKSVLSVALVLTLVDELHDLADPCGGGSLLHLVEGLECEAVLVEDLDGNFQNLAVLHAALEVLLGQSLLEVDSGGVLVSAVQNIVNQLAVEDQIAMQEDQIVIHQVTGQIHGVDVVGLVVDVVADEGEVQMWEVSGFALQLILEGAGGDDEVGDAFCAEQADLTMEDGLAILQTSHGLVIVLSEFTHTVAETGVENNSFHK